MRIIVLFIYELKTVKLNEYISEEEEKEDRIFHRRERFFILPGIELNSSDKIFSFT